MPLLEPYIDAHSHIWTPDTAHYPLAQGFTPADMAPKSFTAEQLLAHCRPAGVGRVNLIQMSFYEFDNSYMLDMIWAYPERFVGTGIVDPLAADPGAAMTALLPRGVLVRFASSPSTASSPRPLARASRATRRCSPRPPARPGPFLPDRPRRVPRGRPDVQGPPGHHGHHRPPRRIGVDGRIGDSDVTALCNLAKHPRMYEGQRVLRPGQEDALYTDPRPMIQPRFSLAREPLRWRPTALSRSTTTSTPIAAGADPRAASAS
ncbi:MAG: amidohydrolase [Isosphaeraceae bacterium]